MDLKDREKENLRRFYIVSEVVKSRHPEFPPTRDELEVIGLTKKHLRELENKGICSSATVIVEEQTKKGGKRICGRVAYAFTDIGAELCKLYGFELKKGEDNPPPTTQSNTVICTVPSDLAEPLVPSSL